MLNRTVAVLKRLFYVTTAQSVNAEQNDRNTGAIKNSLAGTLQVLYGLPIEHAHHLAGEMERAAKLAVDRSKSMARHVDPTKLLF